MSLLRRCEKVTIIGNLIAVPCLVLKKKRVHVQLPLKLVIFCSALPPHSHLRFWRKCCFR